MLPASRLILALFLVFIAGGTARANDGSCGGLGQVPCYNWDWCAWRGLLNECWGGLVAESPWNGCDNSRLNNIGLVCAACGGTGQPTCANAPVCDPRHNAFGLCYKCGGSGEPVCWDEQQCDLGLRNVFGFCSPSGYSQEPATNVTGLPSLVQSGSGSDPVRGIADVHNHQFANLGFGGVVFSGAPYDPRGINSALAWCDYTWDFSTESFAGSDLPPVGTLGFEVHGPKDFQWATNPVSVGTDEGAHDVGGTGPFDGWPRATSVTHQQVYYRWLRRAFEGGLRLMVMHAVSNEAICKASKRRNGWNCDDMPAVDRQIQAVKDLEAAVDRLDDGLLNGSGWYRVAYSPQQARQFIRSGKLAVVLGIEVDSLFGCKPGAGCTLDYVKGQLDSYYRLGVRHLYPIHQFDNALGGAALFKNMLNTGNAIVTGEHFTGRDCSAQGYTYNVEADSLMEFLGVILFGIAPTSADQYPGAADCSGVGLTTLGDGAIKAMMDKKFIIDTDHMSRLMIESVFAIAQARTPGYPLVSGHSTFRDQHSDKTEFSLTDAQLATMRDIGGIVTASTVPFGTCDSSSAFAANYQYALGKMTGGPYGAGYEGVALATDFGGWGTQIRPRFGGSGCGPTNKPGLTYPFTGLFGGSFWRQVTGERTFDFNTDGLAHAGLVPDLIADVKAQGVTDTTLNALYNSAETYIRMWERIDNSDKLPPPTIEAHVAGTAGENGWYTSDVTVTWEVTTSDPDGNPVTSRTGCNPQTITADTRGTVLSCTAATGSGASTTGTVRIRRDATPPSIVPPVSSTPPGTWTNADIVIHFSATDATSGVAGNAAVDVRLTTEGTNQLVQHSFVDAAGNAAVASVSGLNIDRTPPQIAFKFADLPPDATTEQTLQQQALWHNHDVVLVVDARDPLSGLAGPPTPATLVLTAEGPAVHGSATASDLAGNSATISSFDVKIDKTPPNIAFAGRAPAANGFGWNNTDVTATWTCADLLSGPLATPVAAVATGEGQHIPVTGTCTDAAGNKASNTYLDISIDRTPPLVQTTADPPANGAGWRRTDVVVLFTATDALAGIDGADSLTVPIAAEGGGLWVERTFVDRAGNATLARADGINIDKTPPRVSCTAAPQLLWPANHKLAPVTVGLQFTDALSGTAGLTLTEARSSEPDNGLGDGDTAGDVVGFVPGGANPVGALRAERAGGGPGRIYTIGYRGTDLAGNAAACSTTVSVPHDQRSGTKP